MATTSLLASVSLFSVPACAKKTAAWQAVDPTVTQAVQSFLAAALAEGDRPRCDFRRVESHNLTYDSLQVDVRGHGAVLIGGGLPGAALDKAAWMKMGFLKRFGSRIVSSSNGRQGKGRLERLSSFADLLEQAAPNFHVLLGDELGENLGADMVGSIYEELGSWLPPYLQNFTSRRLVTVGRLRDIDPCKLLLRPEPDVPEGAQLCVQLPGDVVYFGDGSLHATCNLESFALGLGGQGHTEKWPSLLRAVHASSVEATRQALENIEMGALEGHAGRDRIPSGLCGPGQHGCPAGQTALQRAVQGGHTALVSLLLRHSADTSAVEGSNMTLRADMPCTTRRKMATALRLQSLPGWERQPRPQRLLKHRRRCTWPPCSATRMS
eukprot:TRINITY_DN44006_c0_g1_i2.p1 TRINITY_DN44006_c0_g1~~TRINITY_DN44006_c0_g1_i2.p1  ORF type:complete len:393 (+),score=47.60 TRINITY_DN44006_c0_g1_i2:38-1180(+)